MAAFFIWVNIMSWYVAKSLEVLRKQLNEMFPNRSKVSDGGIGNAEHASRDSDHNPYIKDKNNVGVVTARDFTFDNNPADGIGIDCHWLAKVLVESKDSRIKYIIWNGRMISSYPAQGLPAWTWRNYSGKNPHKHHLHLSVVADELLFNNEIKWNLGKAPALTENIVKPAAIPNIGRGAKGVQVKIIQQKLVEKGYLKSHQVDGDFGVKTELALQRFQKDNDLRADGVCGEQTRKALGLYA